MGLFTRPQSTAGLGSGAPPIQCSCSCRTLRCVNTTLHQLLTALLRKNYGVGALHTGVN